jgi:hypothetical protein
MSPSVLCALCRFSDAGNVIYAHAQWPASEKRQGTKSRDVGLGRRVPQAQLWGFERGTCHVDVRARREVERLRGVERVRGFAMIASEPEERLFAGNF